MSILLLLLYAKTTIYPILLTIAIITIFLVSSSRQLNNFLTPLHLFFSSLCLTCGPYHGCCGKSSVRRCLSYFEMIILLLHISLEIQLRNAATGANTLYGDGANHRSAPLRWKYDTFIVRLKVFSIQSISNFSVITLHTINTHTVATSTVLLNASLAPF